MIKALSVLLFAALVVADISLTGRFATGTGTFFTPNTAVPCAATTSTTYYKVFNNTFATAGVRTIQLLASTDYPIYIYRGSFDPTAPCTNAQTVSTSSDTFVYRYEDDALDNTQTLQISFGFNFAADLYFIVVTSSSVGTLPAASYSFGVRILEPVSASVSTIYTQGSTPVWQAPYTDSSSEVGFRSNASYVSYTYTATETARFDIGAFAVNSSSTNSLDVSLGVFTGTPTAQQIYDGVNGIFPYDNSDDEGVWLFFFPMTAGQTYTFVASIEDSDEETANFGFFVVPTAAHRLTAGNAVTGTFSEPASFSANSACTSRGDSYVGLPYTVESFNVLGNIVVAKSSDQYSYNRYLTTDLQISGLDWYTYLYRGNNSDSPAGCPITPGISYVSSTDDGTIFNPSASAAVHTLVVSTYSSSPSLVATSGIVIFYFGGETLGESVSVPTGAPTPAPTTSTPTTSTPTTSTPTTSTPTTSTPTSAPTCAPRTLTATVTFDAPAQCSNSTVLTILQFGNANGNNVSCTNTTGNGVSLLYTVRTSDCNFAINTTALLELFQNTYGFTNIAFVLPTNAPTTSSPTTSTPSTAPTTSTPAPAAGTTSGAVNVVASFVVILAVLGLFL